MANQKVWGGPGCRDDLKMELCRPCECGCDKRDGSSGVGYLLFSDGEGKGATVWIESEEVFEEISKTIERLQMSMTDKTN